jgi:hypothetical protein
MRRLVPVCSADSNYSGDRNASVIAGKWIMYDKCRANDLVTVSISDGAHGHKHGSVACAPSQAIWCGSFWIFLLQDVDLHLECCWLLLCHAQVLCLEIIGTV